MLHVTNGGCAASLIRAAGVPGTVLPWDDILHEGPVPAGLDPDALTDVRARFLASSGAGDVDVIRRQLLDRDAALRGEADEVVLWFEHDLYDQLQLLQVITGLPAAVRVTTVFPGTYLGEQSVETIAAWFPTRAVLSDEARRLAVEAWDAFRHGTPEALTALLARLPADDAPLPFLAAALRRHLQQLPSTHAGLSRTEAGVLALVAEGVTDRVELFRRANALEDAVFMGDMAFFLHLASLASGPRPVLVPSGAAYMLTDDGARVAAGAADRVALTGIDRWLGGVHLAGTGPMWRWDDVRGPVYNPSRFFSRVRP